MIDFSLTPRQIELRDKVADFIDSRIVPFESDKRSGHHGPTDELRREMNALAREAGLLAIQAPQQWGGQDLSHLEQAVVFEAAGRSPLGPIALHCAAPDEGNMHLLSKVATPEQQQRWLKPLAAAEIRSCFAMTEPDGAGSDPGMLRTTATPEGDDFVINGRKWLITGADGAGFSIIMANVPVGHGMTSGATMFLADMDSPGIRVERLLDTLDQSFTGGHGEVVFENLRVPKSDVLGAVGEGFRYAQVRLAPARLTHCMRWLGGAQRAHEIAVDHARRRQAFGRPIGEHEGIGFMLADNELDLHQSRLVIWHAAWLLDQGEHGRHESSMAKVAVSEALYRIVDRCVQVLGGLGVMRDTVVERLFREMRSFRIYDGPSEVHRWAIARRALRANQRQR